MNDTEAQGPAPVDELLTEIADYVLDHKIDSEGAFETARYCLLDALGCAIASLDSEECRKRLGPIVPGATLENGSRVPGTDYQLDPVRAAFNIGTMIRWLDYNDTWLATEWGHPSDNLGAILALADYLGRSGIRELTMGEVLTALIKAYEIQGILALDNSFNRVGLDHVILVRIASCAVTAAMLRCGREEVVNALSNAWIDGGALRTYRQAPNTGWRKSWAAGDASARGLVHALMARNGEMGYPTALSAPTWGFCDVVLRGRPLLRPQPFQSYVVENILFKIGYPVEFHAHTAVECALKLHEKAIRKLAAIDTVQLTTQAAAARIIDKSGPLQNPADRDHCLQYAVAVALIHGELTSGHYEDAVAEDPRIDRLREKMTVVVDPRYSRDYLDPEKRSIANAVTLRYGDGSADHCEIEYPLGHPRRREEGLPLLVEKFRRNVRSKYPASWIEEMSRTILDGGKLDPMAASDFMGLWAGGARSG